jgi:hypothetical protein
MWVFQEVLKKQKRERERERKKENNKKASRTVAVAEAAAAAPQNKKTMGTLQALPKPYQRLSKRTNSLFKFFKRYVGVEPIDFANDLDIGDERK